MKGDGVPSEKQVLWHRVSALALETEAEGVPIEMIGTVLVQQGLMRLVMAFGRDGAERLITQTMPDLRAGGYDPKHVSALAPPGMPLH